MKEDIEIKKMGLLDYFKIFRLENETTYDFTLIKRRNASFQKNISLVFNRLILLYSLITSGRMPFRNYVVFIALSKGKAAGVLYIFLKNKKSSMLSIFIDKNFRGMGLGTLLMKKLIEWVDKNRVGIDLYVGMDNAAAIKLYKKFGFKITNYKMVRAAKK